MKLESTRDFMVTNQSINTMLKPNNVNGEFTTSVGRNTDAGVRINNGHFNHQMAIVLDIIYDHMYRMFNEMENTSYIFSSLSTRLTHNDGLRKQYFTKLLTNKKLDFYNRVMGIIKASENLSRVPFNRETRNYLLNTCPDLIDYGFPPEFALSYRSDLEMNCEKRGSFDGVVQLLKENRFDQVFFQYLLQNIFYGKMPSWNGFSLDISLNSIFKDKERTIYVLKDWFEESNRLNFSMTYPVTCFSDHFSEDPKYVPKRLFLMPYMFPVSTVNPCRCKYDKATSIVNVSLINKFMVFFAHDAKLCVKTYVPSSLYKLNSNAFFIGKNILNNIRHERKLKKYANRLNYTMDDFFRFLNLKTKNIGNNTTHKKKAIIKALKQLDGASIIQIDKMSGDDIKLKKVWNIEDRIIDEPLEEDCI
jgi:hypothetical protein